MGGKSVIIPLLIGMGNLFFFLGGRRGGRGSQRRLPATGQLVSLFFCVDSAFALVLVGGLTPFFFRGRSVGGEKCHHPAFDWLLEGEH